MPKVRSYKLSLGDIIFLSDDYIDKLNLKSIQKEKNPNRKWFQFWKPKYIGHKFLVCK